MLVITSSDDGEQKLSRHFTKYSTLSYAVSVLGVLGSVPATFGSPLSLGGPAAAVWAWTIGAIFSQIISMSGTMSNVLSLGFKTDFLSCRTGVCISDGRWHVLRHEKRRASRTCCSLVVGHGLV